MASDVIGEIRERTGQVLVASARSAEELPQPSERSLKIAAATPRRVERAISRKLYEKIAWVHTPALFLDFLLKLLHTEAMLEFHPIER
jgi:hypothetical protein